MCIRIDSGVITQLAKQARKMLEVAGFPDAKITASNALEVTVIQSLLKEGAPKSNLSIGEKLITSASSPVLSGVTKMAACQVNGQWLPKIKVSASREKTTYSSHKQVYRLYHRVVQTALSDVMSCAVENLPAEMSAVNANPLALQTQVTYCDFTAEPLLKPVFPQAQEPLTTVVLLIQKHMRSALSHLPEATQRLVNPDLYPVTLTPKLAACQQKQL